MENDLIGIKYDIVDTSGVLIRFPDDQEGILSISELEMIYKDIKKIK